MSDKTEINILEFTEALLKSNLVLVLRFKYMGINAR